MFCAVLFLSPLFIQVILIKSSSFILHSTRRRWNLQWLQLGGISCAQLHWSWLWICLGIQMRHFATGYKLSTELMIIHPLTLCYGEEASGKYWCDICEKETNPETWFYTSQDHQASFHTECVVGGTPGIMPGSTIKFQNRSYEVMLDTSITRPICSFCESLVAYSLSSSSCLEPQIHTFALGDAYFRSEDRSFTRKCGTVRKSQDTCFFSRLWAISIPLWVYFLDIRISQSSWFDMIPNVFS